MRRNESAYQKIVYYHEVTKHHFHRFARSLGYMDWDNQPNPFRFYEGAQQIALPFIEQEPPASYLDLYIRSNNKPQPFTLASVAGFLELGLGLSAWKEFGGSQWSLRMNPSSGNLHPTEAHLLLPPLDSLQAGVYHYAPFEHALEQRAVMTGQLWQKIMPHFQTEGFLIALTSIFWRESWKYGERAFRYCNHDVGHALAGLSFSGNIHGWKVTYLNGLSERELATILGFDKMRWPELEEEHPDLLCFVSPNNSPNTIPRTLPPQVVSAFSKMTFRGIPNELSSERVDWEIINEAAALTTKAKTDQIDYDYGAPPFLETPLSALSAAQLIRQRRSAVAYDRQKSAITYDQFLSMLDKTIPRNACAPFDVELSSPTVHLLLFVHNVQGLDAGLYFFLRHDSDFEQLKHSCHPHFLWQQVTEGFPLYLLVKGNVRRDAIAVSCQQEIAGFSAFSLGMIAKFSPVIRQEPYRYRHLFWETGQIGQVLYLEAEAAGVRGTGIGCFFDDPVHNICGFKDNAYQSLYHFTIGSAIEDTRLMTYPPYYHLETGRSKE